MRRAVGAGYVELAMKLERTNARTSRLVSTREVFGVVGNLDYDSELTALRKLYSH